jgi:hypothetical protein
VLHDVQTQDVAVVAGEVLQLGDGTMRSLAPPIGETVGDERALEPRLDDPAEGMANDPVAERRGARSSQRDPATR